MAAWHAPDTRLAPSHPRHNHRTTGQEVDVARKLAWVMRDNHPVPIGRIENVDLPGFYDEKVDFGLTRTKDNFTIRVIVSRRQRLENCNLCRRQLRKRCFLARRHWTPSMRPLVFLVQAVCRIVPASQVHRRICAALYQGKMAAVNVTCSRFIPLVLLKMQGSGRTLPSTGRARDAAGNWSASPVGNTSRSPPAFRSEFPPRHSARVDG